MAEKLTRRDLFGLFRRPINTVRESARPESRPPLPLPLRPPGALDEDGMAETCMRCGACINVCPRRAIKKLGPEYGVRAGTPFIVPREAPCVVCDGLQCTTVCPSGALRPVERPEDVRMGRAEIVASRCLPHQGQPCRICVDRCPLPGALVLDDKGLPRVTDACTGCGLCEYYCPTEPAAILVRPTASKGAAR